MPTWLISVGLVFLFLFMLFSAFGCLVAISDRKDKLRNLNQNSKLLDCIYAFLWQVFWLGLFVFDLWIVLSIGKVLYDLIK